MGEEDILTTRNNFCQHACDRKDCDGDWETYCMKNGSCRYQKNVKDCDRDIISLCLMN